MNAMEKAAWTNLLVSAEAVGVVLILFPWLGHRATSAFGLLGLTLVGAIFLHRRGKRVIVDERDREIERKAASISIGTCWTTLMFTLAAANTWANYSQDFAVSTLFLHWVIWTQFAFCFGVKGLAAVVMYRRQAHAA